MSEELKPCAYCGHRPPGVKGGAHCQKVFCNNDLCCEGPFVLSDSTEAACTIWNAAMDAVSESDER